MIARVASLALALAVAGCAARQAPKLKVRKVQVAGNREVPDKQILEGLVMRKPTGLLVKTYVGFDEVAVSRDRMRIESFLNREGYFSAKVTDVDTRRPRRDMIDIIFTVDEGAPTTITRVVVDGLPPRLADPEDWSPWRDILLVRAGEIYKQEDYLTSKANLLAHLGERGYALAKVDGTVEVDRESREAVIKLMVEPGPLTTFGPVRVRGLDRLPESVVKNRIAWKEGETFDPELVELTQARLYQMGFFGSANVRFRERTREAHLPMVVRVREGLRHETRLGIGAAIDNANVLLRPRAGYLQRGVFDPLLTLDLDARPGIIVAGQGKAGRLAGEVTASLERHDFFAPRLRGTLSATAQVTELETYSANSLSGRIGVDRPFLLDRLQLGVGWQLRMIDFTRISPAITMEDRVLVGLPPEEDVAGFVWNYRLGFFEQSLALDLRDNPLDARKGIYAEVRAEQAGGFSGSEYAYSKLTPELRGYFAPLRRLVLAGRARYGTSFDARPPITQRYYSGGSSSHRGFTFRRLSPTSSGMTEDGEIVPIGGNRLLEMSAEVRVDVFELWERWLGFVVFTDAGDVTLATEQMSLGNLHWAAGAGLRYDTVIGPVRFDLGYRLNRFGPGEPDAGKRFAFHLSIGEAF